MYNRKLETDPKAMDAHNVSQKSIASRRLADIAAKKKAHKALKKSRM